MHDMNVKETRKNFAKVLKSVAKGGSVVVTKRGTRVAKIVPVEAAGSRTLPDLSDFRRSIRVKGRAMSAVVIEQRKQERY
jgi:prevent-host-death family protein